jgi:hypothetical protein
MSRKNNPTKAAATRNNIVKAPWDQGEMWAKFLMLFFGYASFPKIWNF